MSRPIDVTRLRGAIAFLREAWRNDGAEGESVHLVCDDAEALLTAAEQARDRLNEWVDTEAGSIEETELAELARIRLVEVVGLGGES